MDYTIKVRTLAILVALIVSAGLASAASETGTDTGKAKGNLGIEDERFIKEAVSGGMMEVALGKTAAEKADNEQVREFGKRMQADHSKSNERLRKIAADRGIEGSQRDHGRTQEDNGPASKALRL